MAPRRLTARQQQMLAQLKDYGEIGQHDELLAADARVLDNLVKLGLATIERRSSRWSVEYVYLPVEVKREDQR